MELDMQKIPRFSGEATKSEDFISIIDTLLRFSTKSPDEYVITLRTFFVAGSIAMDWYDKQIKGKVTVWEELVKKFKQRFQMKLSSFWELYQVAWEHRDRSALFQDVDPSQKYQSLKVLFPLTEDAQERILVTSEYRTALSDAKRWFVGETPSKTKFTQEDSYWRPPVSEDEGEGEDQQMDIDHPDLDDTDWSDPICPHTTFIVCGMPGIGKSVFLYYVLVERLLRNLPTCLQIEPDCFTYWCAEGVSEIQMNEFKRPLSKDVWFLVDSNQDITRPHRNILISGARVLQVASPRKSQLEWTEKRTTFTYKWFMKPSPLPELLMMRPLWPFWRSALTDEQVTTFVEEYGPSPRLIMSYAARPDEYCHDLQSTINLLTFAKFKQLFIEMKHSNMNDDSLSHCIFGVYPDVQRNRTTVDYLTRNIFGLVKATFSTNWKLHARDMYRLFNAASGTRGAAGHLVEDILHGDLPMGGYRKVTQLRKRGKRLQPQKNTIFTTPTPEESRNDKYFFIGSDPGIVEAVPETHDPQPLRVYRYYESNEVESIDFSKLGYYRPYAHNQATFDSLIVNHRQNSVFALQFTVSGEHSVNKYGMQFLKDRFSNYKCYYILFSDRKDVELLVLSDYDEMWQSLWHVHVTEDALFSNH